MCVCVVTMSFVWLCDGRWRYTRFHYICVCVCVCVCVMIVFCCCCCVLFRDFCCCSCCCVNWCRRRRQYKIVIIRSAAYCDGLVVQDINVQERERERERERGRCVLEIFSVPLFFFIPKKQNRTDTKYK